MGNSPDQNCDMKELRDAALSCNLEMIGAILTEWQADSKDGFTQNPVPILREAIDRDLAEVVECFLNHHVPMNSMLVLEATRNTSYRILQAVLDNGWDINEPISSYEPPALASSYHDINLTKWFLDHGANPNQRCYIYRDCTPLSIAFREAEFPIIELLLSHGASLQHGQVLHYAAMRELDDRLDVLEYVLRAGLPINHIMYQNCGDEYQFNMYSGVGAPLHYAAASGLLDSAKLLIEKGASPFIKDPAGKLPLFWAECNGQTSMASFLRPLCTGQDPDPNPQFTDGDGRHFKTVPLEELLKETDYKLV